MDTRTDSTISQYSPGFNHFSVLTLIRLFSGTRRDTFSILARLLPLPSTRPDSTIFRYSHCFYPFPVFALTSCRYSHGFYLLRYLHVFYLFPVLGQILPFFVTNTDSTLFRYSPRQVVDTRTDSTFYDTCTYSTFSQYSARFYHFSVLTLIRPFSGTRRDTFSILARILPFPSTPPDSTNFRYSH